MGFIVSKAGLVLLFVAIGAAVQSIPHASGYQEWFFSREPFFSAAVTSTFAGVVGALYVGLDADKFNTIGRIVGCLILPTGLTLLALIFLRVDLFFLPVFGTIAILSGVHFYAVIQGNSKTMNFIALAGIAVGIAGIAWFAHNHWGWAVQLSTGMNALIGGLACGFFAFVAAFGTKDGARTRRR